MAGLASRTAASRQHDERPVWAVLVDQLKLDWSDRGDAANDRSEPNSIIWVQIGGSRFLHLVRDQHVRHLFLLQDVLQPLANDDFRNQCS